MAQITVHKPKKFYNFQFLRPYFVLSPKISSLDPYLGTPRHTSLQKKKKKKNWVPPHSRGEAPGSSRVLGDSPVRNANLPMFLTKAWADLTTGWLQSELIGADQGRGPTEFLAGRNYIGHYHIVYLEVDFSVTPVWLWSSLCGRFLSSSYHIVVTMW